ncbi:hypothetical protein [Legionella feeleii]|uniref:Legionella vir region protein LvrA n=1 Tax=Legionella feeleii TaxID=453 RepID=A0A378KK92_9GAMM|nr:hypothetical protein [Legionella feeleii]STX88316.1 Legionella vir region protein LvrA [Legionella feeleii]
MTNIKAYNKARLEIEGIFNGLPHVHTTLIKSLITRADPETGIVENISYREIAEFLAIYHSPGRRGAGIPKKGTVRSYFRTIAENHPENFKLVSQGQKFKCQFPKLPAIYAHYLARKEVGTGSSNQGNTREGQAETGGKTNCKVAADACKPCEHPAAAKPQPPVKKNNKITTNNNHNQFQARLKPIAADFVPAPETIAKALALGYSDVGDLEDIQAFIRYNQSIGSRFADYNPVYLRWLSRTAIKADFRPSAEAIACALAQGYSTASDVEEIEAFIVYNQAIGSRYKDYNAVYLSWLAKGQQQTQQKQQKQQKQQMISSQGYSGSRAHAVTKHRTYDQAVAAVAAAYPNPRSPSERLAAEREACFLVNY